MESFTHARRILAESRHKVGGRNEFNSHSFAQRVYSADSTTYLQKLRALGFEGYASVLDAGCGYGQWSLCLAALNESVIASDTNVSRTEFLSQVCSSVEIKNIDVRVEQIEQSTLADNSVDAVFSFGTLFLSDAGQALVEFARVLKPGGRLYFNFPTVWWYAFIWHERHNETDDYSPREVAAHALTKALISEKRGSLGEPILNLDAVRDHLLRSGFEEIHIHDEGAPVEGLDVPSSHSFGPRIGMYPSQMEVIAVRTSSEP